MKHFTHAIGGISAVLFVFLLFQFPVVAERMNSKLPKNLKPMSTKLPFDNVSPPDMSYLGEIKNNIKFAKSVIGEVESIYELIDSVEPELAPKTEYIGEFYLTMYACTIEQCGSTSGVTASGRICTDDPTCWTVAVDPSVIPLGTYLLIEDYPGIVFRADDTGSAVSGNMIDIYSPSEAESKSFPCHGGVKVWIIIE